MHELLGASSADRNESRMGARDGEKYFDFECTTNRDGDEAEAEPSSCDKIIS